MEITPRELHTDREELSISRKADAKPPRERNIDASQSSKQVSRGYNQAHFATMAEGAAGMKLWDIA